MTHHDVTREQAHLLLTREATLAAHYGRRFDQAVGNDDLVAARRWNREYLLSAFRCRTLGMLVRTSAPNTTRSTVGDVHFAVLQESARASRAPRSVASRA